MIGRRELLAAGILAWVGANARAAGARPAARLEGVWTTASYTDLERPAEFPALALTPAQAEAYEAPRRALHGMLAKGDAVGQAENEWTDRGAGLARVRGEVRSSWIIEPSDGRIPYRPEALRFLAGPAGLPTRLDNPEDFNGPSRCVATFAAGAPMVVGPDCNLLQIVQTRAEVAILTEKYHDVRIVRLWRPGEARPAPLPPSWLGDGVGHWEGTTLVVETAGFRQGVLDRNSRLLQTGTTKVTERFTRLSRGELLYEFTVEDPAIYTRPWRVEIVMHPTEARIFEYACHEGNYALPGMLAGARLAERK